MYPWSIVKVAALPPRIQNREVQRNTMKAFLLMRPIECRIVQSNAGEVENTLPSMFNGGRDSNQMIGKQLFHWMGKIDLNKLWANGNVFFPRMG